MQENTPTEVAHLRASVEHLASALERLERRARRARAFAVLGVLAASAGFLLGAQLARTASAEATVAVPADPVAVSAAREELFGRLNAEQRHEVERWERDVAWVSQYMHLYGDRFDPGAMIAVMLARMARSVDAVPEMRAEMQIMNAKMNALPVMAAEVQGINGKMGIMAAGMDSTLGRAGRMMPWSW